MNSQSVPADVERLRVIVRQYPSLLIAYSGGVDSAVVMKVAHEELHEKAMACIGNSPSLARSELFRALDLARHMGARCRVVNTLEYQDPQYITNRGDRCYFCKRHLFEILKTVASNEGWAAIADGVHMDDLHDHVQGMRAAEELDIKSPLREAQLGKAAVREIARQLGLPVWNKPATPCLASRVPVGTLVTIGRLRQIETAERALARLGFHDVRVRHYGDLARVELSPTDLPRALDRELEIVESMREVGFLKVMMLRRGQIT